MAGTTCSAAVFIIRSIVVSEKGWNTPQLNTEKKDAFVSAFMMLLLSGIIMAVAAGTLHIMGLKLNDTVDMIHLFEPLGGKLAALILIAGVSSAGISTIFPIVLIAPWLISDYRNTARDIHSSDRPAMRIYTLFYRAEATGTYDLLPGIPGLYFAGSSDSHFCSAQSQEFDA
jgi:hypothetical protein